MNIFQILIQTLNRIEIHGKENCEYMLGVIQTLETLSKMDNENNENNKEESEEKVDG